MVFDTGSSDLWVASKQCTARGCRGHHHVSLLPRSHNTGHATLVRKIRRRRKLMSFSCCIPKIQSQYDTSASSTAVADPSGRTFQISYADGSKTTGPLSTDSISVGGYNVTNQTLSAVSTMSDSFALDAFAADGFVPIRFGSAYISATPCASQS